MIEEEYPLEEAYPLEYVQELDRLLNLESSETVVAEEVQTVVSSTNNSSGEAISSNLQYVEQKMQQLLGKKRVRIKMKLLLLLGID
mgnify:CR=1 FL=1